MRRRRPAPGAEDGALAAAALRAGGPARFPGPDGSALRQRRPARHPVGHDFTDRASEFGGALGNALHQGGAIIRSTSVSATQYLPHMTIMRAAMLAQTRRHRSGMNSAAVLARITTDVIDERVRKGPVRR